MKPKFRYFLLVPLSLLAVWWCVSGDLPLSVSEKFRSPGVARGADPELNGAFLSASVDISHEGDRHTKDEGSSSSQSPETSKDDPYELQRLFVDTLDQIERHYVSRVDRRRLIEAAIRGMMSELDQHSSYIPTEKVEEFRETVESQYGGVGLQVALEGGRPRVISPIWGSPAYRAGICAGDWILEIEGKSTQGLSLDEIVHRLKGAPGTSVRVKIRRGLTGEVTDIVLTREVIQVPTVVGYQRKADDQWDYFLPGENHIAYVRITHFGRHTAEELRAVLEQLVNDGIKALVLDLRFNPGGLLSSAVAVADLFVSDGVIVSVSGRNTAEQVWRAHAEGTFAGFPVAVLVNRHSASGSEIVAACLQDHGRAVIVGERTWGKGSVQSLISLRSSGSALKLTTATYIRPSGKNIHRFPDAREEDDWGVRPNPGFEVRLSDREMALLLADQRRREIIGPRTPLAWAQNGDGPRSEDSSQDLGMPPAEDGEGQPRPAIPSDKPEGNDKPKGAPDSSRGFSPRPPGTVAPSTGADSDSDTGETGSGQAAPGDPADGSPRPEGTRQDNPGMISPTESSNRQDSNQRGQATSPGGAPPIGDDAGQVSADSAWAKDIQLAKAVEYLKGVIAQSAVKLN
jgi:carboxyl-terminal processing protease